MIIYAVNIHTGGGRVLLDELLIHQPFGKVSAAFIDERYPVPSSVSVPVFRIRPRLWDRFKAEVLLHRFLKTVPADETVLFFGNLPPFFRPRVPSFLYLQNCFLTGQVPLPRDSFKVMLRNAIERFWLKWFSQNIQQIWVQTPWMKKITALQLPKSQIEVKPFLPHFNQTPDPSIARVYDFLYVGSSSKHKRLPFFLEALAELDSRLERRIQVALVLDQMTIPQMTKIYKNIELNIHLNLNRDDLSLVYQKSKNLVMTASYESFGLPLYEAHHFGCRLILPRAGYTDALPFSADYFQSESKPNMIEKMLHAL